MPLPDRQVRLPLPQISGKIYIMDMAKPSNNPAYAIMMEYPVGGHIIFYASPRREPLQKILDKSPKLGTIVKKDFGFDISGIDKFYSVNIKILPEYEQYLATQENTFSITRTPQSSQPLMKRLWYRTRHL